MTVLDLAPAVRRAWEPATAHPVLEVVVPVYNEEAALEGCVRRLHAHLGQELPYSFRITIANNASTDRTAQIADRLSRELDHVGALHLTAKGRGRALRQAWARSEATVVAYMDVDLSTDLRALAPLVASLVSGHSDLAIGSRLARGARVVRGAKREFISRSYNLLLRGALRAHFSDAQCGFKAVRRDVALQLLPLVADEEWFFDSELLVLAERIGLRIHEVPVDWVDDPDSRVDIVPTALADLRGVARVSWSLARGRVPLAQLRAQLGRAPLATGDPQGAGPGALGDPRGSGPDTQVGDVSWPAMNPTLALIRQLVRFGAIGVVSTLAYVALFAGLRLGVDAQIANFLALLITAVANTAANRRLTFGVSGRESMGRHQLQGLVVFGIGLALTSGSLGLLDLATSDRPGRWPELGVVVTANLVATLIRFLLLRRWVFVGATTDTVSGTAESPATTGTHAVPAHAVAGQAASGVRTPLG